MIFFYLRLAVQQTQIVFNLNRINRIIEDENEKKDQKHKMNEIQY